MSGLSNIARSVLTPLAQQGGQAGSNLPFAQRIRRNLLNSVADSIDDRRGVR